MNKKLKIKTTVGEESIILNPETRADLVSFNNENTNLNSENIQEAIEELANKTGTGDDSNDERPAGGTPGLITCGETTGDGDLYTISKEVPENSLFSIEPHIRNNLNPKLKIGEEEIDILNNRGFGLDSGELKTNSIALCHRTPAGIYVIEQSKKPLETGTFLVGFEIDENNPDPEGSVTYIDGAMGMPPGSAEWWDVFPFNGIFPCLVANGNIHYKLNKEDITKKEDGTPADITTGNDGDVMMALPKIWLSIRKEKNIIKVKLSNIKADDTFKCLHDYPFNASMSDRVAKNRLFISVFPAIKVGSGESIQIRSLYRETWGAESLYSKTPYDCEQLIAKKGKIYQPYNFHVETLIQVLYILFYKTLSVNNHPAKFLFLERYFNSEGYYLPGIIVNPEGYCQVFNNKTGRYVISTRSYVEANRVRGYTTKTAGSSELGFLWEKPLNGSTSTYYSSIIITFAKTTESGFMNTPAFIHRDPIYGLFSVYWDNWGESRIRFVINAD